MSEQNKINDGGPAFPRPASEFTKNGTLHDGNDAIDQQDGMSLRDYFAAKAMQSVTLAIGSAPDATPNAQSDAEFRSIASVSYRLADAMLVARKK